MSSSENAAPSSVATAATGVDKRRSTRVVQAMPIKVHGVDALSEPFTERTMTVMVSCHGCKYQSRHYVPKGSIVTVEIPRRSPNAPARIIAGNVIWVQRPMHARDLLHIGLEFEVPGNVWDYPSPPDDWFPLPGEQPFALEDEEIAEPQAIPVPAPAAPVTLAASWDASEILTIAGRVEGHENDIAAAMEQAKTRAQQDRAAAAEAAVETLSLIRPKTDASLHETIEHAVKASMEKFSTTIIDEVRRAHQTTIAHIDDKIQSAVAEAIKNTVGRRPNRGKGKP
jgi:hypothetical protein